MTDVVKKVDYKKCSDKWGAVYDQTITIDIDTALDFNKYVWELKEEINAKLFMLDDQDFKILDYLEVLNPYNPTYATLTTLRVFKQWYINNIYTPPKRDIFIERILDRNTRFIVVGKKRV